MNGAREQRVPVIVAGVDVTDVVHALVDAAPPLTPEQQDRLVLLMGPALPRRSTAPDSTYGTGDQSAA